MAVTQERNGRIAKLQQEMQAKEISGAAVIYPIDIFYYAGTRQNSVLWIPAQGEPLLLVRKSLTRARQESSVADIRPFPSSKEFAGVIGGEGGKIGLTFDVLPVQQLKYYEKLLPGRELVDISAINRDLRAVKSPWELEQMRASARKLCEVFAQVPSFLKPGMREVDLAAEFEYRLRKSGSEGYVRMRAFNQELFMGLAVAGAGATEPGFFDGAVTGLGLSAAAPHGASQAVIEPNLPIVVDYTGIFNGYMVDMTRMYVIGDLAPELKKGFDTTLQIQDYLMANLRPGEICQELFAQAAEMAKGAGYGDTFMGVPGEQAKFVGHGVGLELDELPILAQGFNVPLRENQTIAIEPKIVFPGKGVVGIENTFAVGAAGGEKLTDFSDKVVYL